MAGYKCSDPACGKTLYKRGDEFVEEQRQTPPAGAPAYSGDERRNRPPKPPEPQKPPRRDHFLTRPLFGHKEPSTK